MAVPPVVPPVVTSSIEVGSPRSRCRSSVTSVVGMYTSSSNVTISFSSFFGMALRSICSGGCSTSGASSRALETLIVTCSSFCFALSLVTYQMPSTAKMIRWMAKAITSHGAFFARLRK
jgi:hypothetical protein